MPNIRRGHKIDTVIKDHRVQFSSHKAAAIAFRIPYLVLMKRLSVGWNLETALTTPVRKFGNARAATRADLVTLVKQMKG
jgi:hypothetical protein